MATHCRILAWEIPWREEPGGLQSMEWPRVRHDWANNTTAWKRFRNIHLDALLPAVSLEPGTLPGTHLDVQQILLNERINRVSYSSLLSALVIKRWPDSLALPRKTVKSPRNSPVPLTRLPNPVNMLLHCKDSPCPVWRQLGTRLGAQRLWPLHCQHKSCLLPALLTSKPFPVFPSWPNPTLGRH